MSGRRLGYDAARLQLRQAQADARGAAAAARMARAEANRLTAERAASHADGAAVADARRALRDAQLEARAAAARVKSARARVAAERAALGSVEPPLARMRARHDAVLARWMEYETDPAKLLAFPAMSDGRQPATASFLRALEHARDLRPAADGGRITPAEFGAYRSAVEDLERRFDAAERTVRGGGSPAIEVPAALKDAARTIVARSTEALGRTAEALGSWNRAGRRDAAAEDAGPAADAGPVADARRAEGVGRTPDARSAGRGLADPVQGPPAPDGPPPASDRPPPASDRPIWPVPRRDGA